MSEGPVNRGGSAAFEEDDLLPISAVSDFVFCRRRAGLHLIEQQWEDNLSTVEGSILHERSHEGGPTEARPGIRIARSLRLRSLTLGLVGVADVVEFHRADSDSVGAPSVAICTDDHGTPAIATEVAPTGDRGCVGVVLPGVKGRWRPFPIEYKRGRMRDEESFAVQACAQALCLEECLGCCVPEGAVFYGKSQRRLAVVFDDELRARTCMAVSGLHEMVRSGRTPPPEPGPKCKECSMEPVCRPKVTGAQRSAELYLAGILDGMEGEP